MVKVMNGTEDVDLFLEPNVKFRCKVLVCVTNRTIRKMTYLKANKQGLCTFNFK